MAEARHDHDTERAVLGAMLQNPEIFDECTAVLAGPGDFHKPTHAALYQAMTALRDDTGDRVDALSLTHAIEPAELKRLGGADYLQACMAAAPLISAGPKYARELRGLATMRDMQALAAVIAHRAGTLTADKAHDLVELAQASIADITAGDPARAELPAWSTLVPEAFTEMENIQQQAETGVLPGLPTGWTDLDQLLNNLQGGQVVVVAGRPGIGKSIAGRCIAQHVAMRRKTPALICSLEMSRHEITMALLSAGAGVPLNAIRSGTIDDMQWGRLARYFGDTEDALLYVDDTVRSIAEARTIMRRQIRDGRKPGLVVWDYLQLTQTPGPDRGRQEAVSALSRDFKLFAREFDIPVVLLSQLNRGPEQRQDKRPTLADLRESGSIEQDADIVILLHSDAYYDKESPRAGEIDFIVAKNRHGGLDTVTLAAQLHLQRFMDFAIA